MRVLVADDHELLRRGIRFLLSTVPEFEVCGEAVDGRDAIEKASRLNPDIVIMDLSMPRLDGVEATREIKRILPNTQVLILTQHENHDLLRQAIAKAGATGYIGKSSISTELLGALKQMGKGQPFFPREAAGPAAANIGVPEILQRNAAFEKKLRESEERFRLVANTAPVMIWMSGPDKLCTYFNRRWVEFTGRALEEELGNGWVQGVHADDLSRCLDTFGGAFERREPYQMEYRLRRNDGEYRWILASGVPRFNADGSLGGYIGSGIDVTERKLAEEALSTVSQRLIEAHEEERTRIARELHDDINQRLALLAVNLDRLTEEIPTSAPEAKQEAQEAAKQVEDLGNDVQALSHRLHSSKLEHLGLVAAANSFCRELADRHQMEIEFHFENIPKDLSQEISLCLFRVLQEGLQNAAKYSGSRQAKVSLTAGSNEIRLTVQDSGVGFDLEEAIKGRGLGLSSMKERLKLVSGELSIHSQPQQGTTIHACVPLVAKAKSADAAN